MKHHDSRFAARAVDFITDVSIEMRTRLSRTILMMVAVALSTGAMLSSVGISQSAAHQVDAEIAASTLDLVSVTVQGKKDKTSASNLESTDIATWFPADTVERVRAVENVKAAGMRLPIDTVVSPINRKIADITAAPLELSAIDSGYLVAAQITAPPTAWLLNGTEKVAFLGQNAAERLNIPVTADTSGLKIELGGDSYSIGGFLLGNHSLTSDVVIPYQVGLALLRSDANAELLIRTAIGAGGQISKVARVAILPEAPEKLVASQVSAVDHIRTNVSDQLARQAGWIGAFLMVLTTLLIANSMIVSVTARTTEIGVRRALGSSRRDVATVFLLEGALVGFVGGLFGSAVAALLIVIVSAISGWTAVLSLLWIATGPLLGTAVGVLASAYPAIRASNIHPAIAVRSD